MAATPRAPYPLGLHDELTREVLDRTANACAWLLPLAEQCEQLYDTPPVVARWLEGMLSASEQGLIERTQ